MEISPNEVKLTDLFTKNGTYINDTRLQKGKQQKLNITLTSSLSSCIKFGNVIGNFRFSSKEDSGYDDYESNNSLLHKNHHNLSDTIPPSPERSISQNTVYSRLKKKNDIFSKETTTTTTTTSSNNNHSTKLLTSPSLLSSQILAPSTPENKSINMNQYNESIRKNIELLEEDDFYIPETQEVFCKDNRRYSNESQKQKQKQPQNRIFDETESIIRICTQDFNEVDEKTTDSDDLLRDVIVPDNKNVENITESKVTEKEKPEDIIQGNNDEKMLEINKKKNDDGFANGDIHFESEYDEEMSTLKWNETASTKTIRNDKSESTTPDLHFENDNLSKSGSATPDFDVIVSILESEKQNSSKLPPENKSDESENPQKLKEPSEQHQIENKDNNNDKDDDNDEYLEPTQPFINRKLLINTEVIKNSLKISPSNKENTPKNLNDNNDQQVNSSINNLDDSLELTQIFPHKDKFSFVIGKTASVKSFEKIHDIFLKPAPIMEKNLHQSTPKPISNTSNNHDNNGDKDNDDDDDEILGPTQPFIRPPHIPVITSKMDNKFSSTTNNTNIATKSLSIDTNSKSISSSNDNTSSIKPISSTTLRTSSPSILSQFDFDICTPNWDCIKLPKEDEIKKAGKIFNEISKNQKHDKCIFEESSSSSSEDDDYHDDIKFETVKQEKNSKKINDKKDNEIKNKNGLIKTRSRKNNEKSVEKEENLIKKEDILKETENKQKVTRRRKISEKSNEIKIKSEPEKKKSTRKNRTITKTEEKQIASTSSLQSHQQQHQPQIQKETRNSRTRRLSSKDTDSVSDKLNHKRNIVDENKDELPSKRKRRNEEVRKVH